MNLEELKAPFGDKDIEWRVQQAGLTKDGKPWARIIPYIDARAVMDRLDQVVGPMNWVTNFRHIYGENNKVLGVMCTLSIKDSETGGVVDKEDGSDETDLESFKGGISKALVRAAVQWGIGRYLYDEQPRFATFVDQKTPGAKYAKIENQNFYWVAPSISDAAPAPQPTPKRDVPNHAPQTPADPGDYFFTFGKYFKQQKKIKDVPLEDLDSYAAFLQDQPGAMDKKPVAEVVNYINKHLEKSGYFDYKSEPAFDPEEKVPF